MAFSAPYSQMDWGRYHEEDRIVIYNISSSKITTATWENNGNGGHWVPEYRHSWNIQTSYDPNIEDWYSFPMFLQDNETQKTDMKILSPDITLQLIGTKPMELFYDPRMESPSSKPYKEAPEVILGFGNDRSGNVEWTNPGMRVHGATTITFPEKQPSDHIEVYEDGRSGQPYHSFPMGTICAAIPNQTYNFTMTAKCNNGYGRFKMSVSCTDWKTKSQYSTLPGSNTQVLSYTFGSSFETIYGSYTVPNDINAWFLQGILEFIDSSDYDVTLFSVKRERTTETTDNFCLNLSGKWYNVSKNLKENDVANFSLNPQDLCTNEGNINFTAFIKGNRYGMINLIYHEPILLSRNAKIRANNFSNHTFNLSLTKTISRNSAAEMIIWKSNMFKKYPYITEIIARFLMTGISGYLYKKIYSDATTDFKLIPFSTDDMYDNITIKSDDRSGMKHEGKNGNLWLTCNCPNPNNERSVYVTLSS
jgi:hypothetical protein